jgi:hypothetical protein
LKQNHRVSHQPKLLLNKETVSEFGIGEKDRYVGIIMRYSTLSLQKIQTVTWDNMALSIQAPKVTWKGEFQHLRTLVGFFHTIVFQGQMPLPGTRDSAITT